MSNEPESQPADEAPPVAPGADLVPAHLQRLLDRLQEQLPDPEKATLSKLRPSLGALIVEARSFSGPHPPPEMLREYEAVLPGSADRIFTMAEKQQDHRIRLESIAVPSRERRADRGQWAALTVSLTGFAVAGYALHEGYPWAAVAIGGADLAVLAGLFLAAKESVIRSLRKKAPEAQE